MNGFYQIFFVIEEDQVGRNCLFDVTQQEQLCYLPHIGFFYSTQVTDGSASLKPNILCFCWWSRGEKIFLWCKIKFWKYDKKKFVEQILKEYCKYVKRYKHEKK